MSLPESLDKLIEPLKSLQNLLDRYKGRGVIIGGIANGFLGKPRLTVDLDAMFLASIKDIPHILGLAENEGNKRSCSNSSKPRYKTNQKMGDRVC